VVEPRHGALGELVARFDADDDAVRSHEIVDGRALLEELGVRDHMHLGLAALHQAAHTCVRAHWHRALEHQHALARGALRDQLGHGVHGAEIGATVAARRRAHGDEDGVRVGHGAAHVLGEGEPAGVGVALDQLGQAGLEDGDLAALQGLDLGRVHVCAHDLLAGLGEAGAADQTDVSRTDHAELHGFTVLCEGCYPPYRPPATGAFVTDEAPFASFEACAPWSSPPAEGLGSPR